MNDLFALSDISTALDGEPRIRDLLVAERLGYERPREIRTFIKRNIEEIETYGVCCIVQRTPEPGSSGGRPSTEFWLNEGQCLVVCALSRTAMAAAVRRALIELFMAFRRGELPLPMGAETDHERLRDNLDTVNLAYRVHGRDYARRLWQKLALPQADAPDLPTAVNGADPEGCLAHLLMWRLSHPDGTSSTVGDLVGLFRGDTYDAMLLREHGIHPCPKGWQGYFAVASCPTALRPLRDRYHGTAWADQWAAALLGLPGARKHPSSVWFGTVSRAVLIPFSLIHDEIDEATRPKAEDDG